MLMKQGQISAIHGDDAQAEKAGSYQTARTLLPSKQGCRPRH
jgi:hypothetical protein